MKIRLAEKNDLNALVSIARSCDSYMRSKGIFQWTDDYPSLEAFENDLKRHELYILEFNNSIIGCITVSTYMDNVYQPVKWLTPNYKNIYIHRLAIQPKEQGKGYAQKLMNYAEKYAITNGFQSIRLDTFSKNPKNCAFYETRGYTRLEEIYFPLQSEYPFYCYELILTENIFSSL
ncbi:GNAT family N-acetyltransferase [Leptobacterium sp. I13]|uniref:GNAT family N-acetyltransferase n=1 Tax=Leptobacterium meishanense TaxID=3128904 RepID=UPI0030EB348F